MIDLEALSKTLNNNERDVLSRLVDELAAIVEIELQKEVAAGAKIHLRSIPVALWMAATETWKCLKSRGTEPLSAPAWITTFRGEE